MNNEKCSRSLVNRLKKSPFGDFGKKKKLSFSDSKLPASNDSQGRQFFENFVGANLYGCPNKIKNL
jgi:hypothetical protein